MEKLQIALGQVLADTAALELQARNFHWHVTGPQFAPLHAFFEDQYEELAEAADELAERLRALGQPAPATFREFLALTTVADPARGLAAPAMLAHFAAGHEAVLAAVRPALEAARAAGDPASEDLLVERRRAHEKHLWMVRAHLA